MQLRVRLGMRRGRRRFWLGFACVPACMHPCIHSLHGSRCRRRRALIDAARRASVQRAGVCTPRMHDLEWRERFAHFTHAATPAKSLFLWRGRTEAQHGAAVVAGAGGIGCFDGPANHLHGAGEYGSAVGGTSDAHIRHQDGQTSVWCV